MTNWLPIHFYQEVPRLSLYLVGYGIFIFHISNPRCVGCATGTWDLGGPAWKALTNNQPPGISCFCNFLPHLFVMHCQAIDYKGLSMYFFSCIHHQGRIRGVNSEYVECPDKLVRFLDRKQFHIHHSGFDW